MTELTLGELKALNQHSCATEDGDLDGSKVHTERSQLVKHTASTKIARKPEPLKKRGKGPVTLSNDVAYNPYVNLKLGKKGASGRLQARDPRFSDFSGTLNDDLFRKSYSFLGDMLQEEVKEIKSALRAGERAGANSLKAASALGNIAHMNISSFSDAKRALDRYTTQQRQLQSDQEMRELKRGLIAEEKEKIATTSKTPFYYSTKKIKQILRKKEERSIESALQSSAINADGAGDLHKKVSKLSKRKLMRQRRSGEIAALTKRRNM
ncbi:hypothetical protein BaOVIS_009380 [Babesia ovis]|uniref:rRNA biogenesis protein RRP36 n=1 Tax=Babesia ovis TaxID=5869 RepID=A0A9W5WU65_BABOV|nr:hypothetical protein BaOVIS_009380 [Babesia ovis]